MCRDDLAAEATRIWRPRTRTSRAEPRESDVVLPGRVQFLGEQPAVVWCYDKLSRIERPESPKNSASVELQTHRRPDVNSCRMKFADLYGGMRRNRM